VVICPSNIERAWSSHDGVMNDKPISYYLPDYLNDLNAMHEAEKVLIEKQWVQYEEEIRTVVLGGIRLVSQWTKADIHATAAQKSKAFLQTLGLWTATPTQPR
jgi:hypothetical protein